MRVRNAIVAMRVPILRSFKPAAGMIQMGKHVSTALPYFGKAPGSKEAGTQPVQPSSPQPVALSSGKRITHAPANKNTTISKCYRKHEAEKKRAYEQRILEVEQSTFTPLIFSATGGMAKQSTTFYKRLASLLADKWEHSYSSTLSWLRCLLSFSLLRSAIQCIRGARSSCGHASRSPLPIDLVSAEAHLSSGH